MNKIDEIITNYQQIIEQSGKELGKVQSSIYRISTLRLILFVAGIAGIIYCWQLGWAVLTVVIAFTFIPLVLLVKYHNQLFHRKEYIEKKIEINRQEIDAQNYNTSHFEDGAEFIDTAHLYSFDIDVFGANSLFQYINRTSTKPGKMLLAHWMGEHLEDKEAIEIRQQAVDELATQLGFRQEFRILGLLHKGEAADEEELKAWAKSASIFHKKAFFRCMPYAAGGVNALCIALAIAGVMSYNACIGVWMCFVIASFAFSHRTGKVQSVYGKKLQILGTYSRLLCLIEQLPVKSTELTEVKRLISDSNLAASEAIGRLNKLMNALDQRNNVFMCAILNGLFFWEVRQIMRIERWKESNANKLPEWIIAIAHIDALCSIATFAYNNPQYSYPIISKQPFCIRAKGMGHPLMNRNTCMTNDINMHKRPYFIIITGANMAGKSTYLRTIGVNYLLACIGAPTCTKQMELYPAKLITSLRTSDSLNDNESYFFAELKRLKLIIDLLQSGNQLFIILDEILKGTNSTDKQKGSIGLVKQLISLQTNGIIATHDLMLGTLIDVFPNEVSNYRFEADISNNELTFSYKLREGVAQNMNACFLMKKMGIAVGE